MKIHVLSCFFLISLFTCSISCSKKDDTGGSPIIPVIPKPDTLTSGWTKASVGITDRLYDVVFVNPTTGYTVGRFCYKSLDGGISWTKLSYPQANTANLAATPDGKLFTVNTTDTIFKTADGGATFTPYKTSLSGILDIFFPDNSQGYAIHPNGLLQTTNTGVSWSAVNPLNGLPASSDYSSVFFINAATGWVSRGSDIYKTNGNINNWVKSTFNGTPPSGTAGAIFLYALSPAVVYAGQSGGKIYKSVDGGTVFSSVADLPRTDQSDLLDIHFLDAANGYCCYGNRIYKTINGGSSWQPVVSLGTESFIEIHFTDPNNGWGCTSQGSVLRFHQ